MTEIEPNAICTLKRACEQARPSMVAVNLKWPDDEHIDCVKQTLMRVKARLAETPNVDGRQLLNREIALLWLTQMCAAVKMPCNLGECPDWFKDEFDVMFPLTEGENE